MPMALGLLSIALLLGSGALVGLSLGLIGGGGSVLAVPLLVYLVGVPSAMSPSAHRPLPSPPTPPGGSPPMRGSAR